MSGGVDSAVALLRARPDAIGVTLRLWLDPAGPDAERACCSPDAVIRARQTCHALGLPHVTLDLREAFRDAVVRPFVAGYAAGLTPNPCMRCNGVVPLRRAGRVRRPGRSGRRLDGALRARRRAGRSTPRRARRRSAKDQSYMLATLGPDVLDRVAFPLGAMTKTEVRAEASAAGLDAARRPESQEACFLAGGDYRAFLSRNGVASRPGPIVDEAGDVVGRHDGLWRFTPGQRRGIGVASPAPLYALRSDRRCERARRRPAQRLRVTRVDARGDLYVPVGEAEAKLRYRSEPVAARVTSTASGFALELAEPVEAAAPGQIAVLYDGDAVVGAGVIERATG